MEQSSFSDLEYQQKKKPTRKEKFLGEMEQVIPWKQAYALIRRYYPKAGNGRQPMPLETMLRIYFLQQWYGLSDPAMEDSLYDIQSLRQFAKLDYDQLPDESTILRFRHLLGKHDLTEKLFRLTEQYLSDQGLILSQGTIVDASIINASSSTKNQDHQRDPEMKQTKKGNTWLFGMKTHIGTDIQGRVHTIVVTDAVVHDSRVMDDLIHGEESVLYGDKAYARQERLSACEAQGIDWCICRKARRGKKLNAADKAFKRKSNPTRAEHAFGVVKHLCDVV